MGQAAAQPTLPFPDAPPWHWASAAVTNDAQAGLLVGYPSSPASLVANAVQQVYDGFVHAHAAGARAWVERFTYDRPSDWPAPLAGSHLGAFSLNDLTPVTTGGTGTVTFVARVTAQTAASGDQTRVVPMRVDLRLVGGDWQVDYASLAAGGAPFR